MDSDSLARSAIVDWIGRPEHQPLAGGSRPLLPADDPFFTPPPGYQHAGPGTVLRSRDVELAFLGLIPQRMRAVQLLYRTTGRAGETQAAVTTVVLPRDEARAGTTSGRLPGSRESPPIVSYQCAIDAVSGRCFPSYALRRRARAIGSFTQVELLIIAMLVAQGWAVSVPDHEGPHGEWGAPYEPGYRILDGVRAAVSTPQLGLSPTAPVGIWGYSGGGLASAWAAEVCADYAPELDIVGAALGSPVGDLGNTLRRLNGSFWSGLPGMMIASLAHIYPGLETVIAEHADDAGRELLHSLESMTTAGAIWRMRHLDLDDFVDRPLEQILDLPAVHHVLVDTKLGTAGPTPPVLMMQAIHDPVISVDDIDALAREYTERGTRLSYHRDMLSDHLLLYPLSVPTTVRWLRDRFAGKPLTGLGTHRGWPKILNPATYLGLLRAGLAVGEAITGRAVRRHRL